LHAATTVPAADRAALERLCKYISRPPIATERLELTADGSVRYNFRKAWRNGRTFVDYAPLEFLERLVPLIPRPRLHLIHFHGVLAPRSRMRPLIVPRQESEDTACGHRGLEDRSPSSLPDDTMDQIPEYEDFPARQISKRTWSQLLSRGVLKGACG